MSHHDDTHGNTEGNTNAIEEGTTPRAANGIVVGPIDQLAAALAKAQATIATAARNSTNPHYRSRYADLASVFHACKESLTRHGLAVSQMPDFDPTTGCVSVTTLLMHTSGQYLVATSKAPVAKADVQGVGSAITYLRRYGLAAITGVAPEDDDGEAAIQPLQGGVVYRDSAVNRGPSRVAIWPFGKRKGTPLRDLTDEELEARRDWCASKDEAKFAELIEQIDEELEARASDQAA